MPQKRPIEHPRGRVSLECRSTDSARILQHDEFESARPIRHGEALFFTVPWYGHWFDPQFHLGCQFPYIGKFEGELSNLWFACDGSEVASFVPWRESLSEMEAESKRKRTGEVDLDRLAAFQEYMARRSKANAELHSQK